MAKGFTLVIGWLLLCATLACGGRDPAPFRNTSEPTPAEPEVNWKSDPTSLPGTVLWLDAGRGVQRDGERVTGWLDQSDARNHAVARSERAAPSFAEVALNGRPALLFDGKSQHLAVEDASALQFGTGDFTLAAVLSHTTPTASEWGYGCIASKQESTHPYLGPSLWGNSESRTGQLLGQLAYHSQRVLSGADDLNQGAPLLAVLQRRSVRGGTKLILRVNGNEARSTLGPTVDVSAPGSPLHIGGTPDARQALRGNIAEIVAIKGPLAEADSESLEAYLREKYGL